jgi:hypothetical protein
VSFANENPARIPNGAGSREPSSVVIVMAHELGEGSAWETNGRAQRFPLGSLTLTFAGRSRTSFNMASHKLEFAGLCKFSGARPV